MYSILKLILLLKSFLGLLLFKKSEQLVLKGFIKKANMYALNVPPHKTKFLRKYPLQYLKVTAPDNC